MSDIGTVGGLQGVGGAAAEAAKAAAAQAAADAAAAAKAAESQAAQQAATEAAERAAEAQATAERAAEAARGGNEENKFRRLHEAAEARAKAAEAKAAALEAAEAARARAELSDLERAKAEAADFQTKAEKAEAKAALLERERLIERIVAEHGLPADQAAEWLSATDEAGLRAQAVKLAAIMKQPAVAGTTSQPSRGGSPSIDDQINAALKAGQTVKAIQLKREKASAPSS